MGEVKAPCYDAENGARQNESITFTTQHANPVTLEKGTQGFRENFKVTLLTF